MLSNTAIVLTSDVESLGSLTEALTFVGCLKVKVVASFAELNRVIYGIPDDAQSLRIVVVDWRSIATQASDTMLEAVALFANPASIVPFLLVAEKDRDKAVDINERVPSLRFLFASSDPHELTWQLLTTMDCSDAIDEFNPAERSASGSFNARSEIPISHDEPQESRELDGIPRSTQRHARSGRPRSSNAVLKRDDLRILGPEANLSGGEQLDTSRAVVLGPNDADHDAK